MEPVYEVHGLCKYYGKKAALDGVDFTVEPGKLVGLLGPNGSGRDVGQFGLGVERAHLGGVGDVDHTGLHLMLVAGVGAVFFHRVADLPCRDLAVFIGQGLL